MPPKGLRRPAAAAVARDHRRGAVRRRPAVRGGRLEGEAEDGFDLEKFQGGDEFRSHLVPPELWTKGTKVILTGATYWEEPIKASGIIQNVVLDGRKKVLSMELLGTQSETLIKWKGSHPGRLLEVDLCLDDCGKVSKDGLIHCTHLRLWKDHLEEGWMRIAEGMEMPVEDELAELRKRGEGLAEEGRGEKALREDKDPKRVSPSSSRSRRKKKKKKEKKDKGEDKRKEKDKKEIQGVKNLTEVFGKTGLDPRHGTRRKMLRRAKKVAKKKGKKDSSSSSRSSTSGSSGSEGGEGSNIFGEEIKVKTVWGKVPGALTWGAISQMQTSLVRQSGEPWELSQDQVPPIFSQYWRQFLHPKMSGPMNREVQTICFAQDLLIQGRIAQACDVLTQRVKSLEQISGGSDYRISQRQELAPHEVSSLSTNVETLDASRLHREELKAKAASSRGGWERRKGDQDHWGVKGKGKSKDPKGKGKKGNWRKGDEREEKEHKKKGD